MSEEFHWHPGVVSRMHWPAWWETIHGLGGSIGIGVRVQQELCLFVAVLIYNLNVFHVLFQGVTAVARASALIVRKVCGDGRSRLCDAETNDVGGPTSLERASEFS